MQEGANSYEPPDASRKSLLSTVFAGMEAAGEFRELQQILSTISASHSGDSRQPQSDATVLQGTLMSILSFITMLWGCCNFAIFIEKSCLQG